MKKSKFLLILTALIITCGMLSACQKSDRPQTEDKKAQTQTDEKKDEKKDGETTKAESKQIIIGQTWVQGDTDPTNSGTPWGLTSHGISETVFRLDKDGKLTSRFIESFKKVDPLTWTAVTKNTAKFSNGDVVDAKALAECLNTIQEKNALFNATAGKVTFTAKDDKTLEIKTERELQLLDSFLTEWANIVFKQLPDKSYVFTGPYVIDSFKPDIEFNLKPNPNYEGADKRADVKILAFKDASAMKLAFDAGEIDMAFTVTPEVAKMIKDAGKNVKTIDAGYQYFGIFNLNSDIMKDEKVRQAINLGINRDEYVKSLMGGRVATGFFAQYFDFAGDVKLSQDLEKAKKLLDEAGYVMKDKARVKDGKTLDINITTYQKRPDLPIIMQIMASQLKELGFNVNTQIVDGIDNVGKSGDFDLILYAQHTAPTGDPAFSLNQFFRAEQPKNFSKYKSDEMNKILDELGKETDKAKRIELAKKAQALVAKDLPVLYLVDPQWSIAVSDRLSDYQPYNGDYYIVNDQLK